MPSTPSGSPFRAGLAMLTGEPVSEGGAEHAPSTCKKCRATVEPVTAGRWAIHPGVCMRCRAVDLDAERKAAAARMGRDGLAASGLPERYRVWTFDRVLKQEKGEPWPTFQARVRDAPQPTIGVTKYNAAAARTLRDWTPAQGSVYLSGHVGAGKSILAAAAVRAQCERGVVCKYVVEGVLRGLQGDALEALVRAPVLFWDDWSSTASPLEWMRDKVESLIMRRYDACRPIIWTSNERLDMAGAKWGQRVGSRLSGMCEKPMVLEIVDHDWRSGTSYINGTVSGG